MPDEPGIAVFKGTPSNMTHIGLYVGNGMVVDARCSEDGVLFKPKNSHGWTHWGRLAGVDYGSGALYRAKVINVKTGLNLRTSPQLAMNTILLLKINTVVDVLEDNCGNGFCRVRYGSTVGYCTRRYLLQLDT